MLFSGKVEAWRRILHGKEMEIQSRWRYGVTIVSFIECIAEDHLIVVLLQLPKIVLGYRRNLYLITSRKIEK
jgi:hypothetical protein